MQDEPYRVIAEMQIDERGNVYDRDGILLKDLNEKEERAIEDIIKIDRDYQRELGLPEGEHSKTAKRFLGIDPEDKVAKQVTVSKGARVRRPAKKPRCVLHKREMRFDPVEQKWKCDQEDCKVTARPKREAEELILGKGNVNLRIVYGGPTARFVLISDDSVALEVTSMLSSHVKKELLRAVEEDAANARGEGENSRSVPKQARLTLSLDSVFLTNLL